MPADPSAPPADVGPTRTCVGCRRRGPAAGLLRVVAGGSPAAAAPDRPGPLVPDPRRRLPGRGAWLHPDPACLDLAIRRRAFERALRIPGPLDAAAVGLAVAPNGSPTRA